MSKGVNANISELIAAAGDPKVFVSAVVVRPKKEVLLIKGRGAPYDGVWHLPGGQLRFGTSFKDTLEERLAAQLGVSPIIPDARPFAIAQTALPQADGSVVYVLNLILRAQIDPFGSGPATGVGVAEWRFFDETALSILRIGGRTRLSPDAVEAIDLLLGWDVVSLRAIAEMIRESGLAEPPAPRRSKKRGTKIGGRAKRR